MRTGAEGGEALLWEPGRRAEDGAGCSAGKPPPPGKMEGSSGCGAEEKSLVVSRVQASHGFLQKDTKEYGQHSKSWLSLKERNCPLGIPRTR